MIKPITIAGQKTILGSLPQGTAAWLVGMSTRAFRDTDAPRKPDGTYDAVALVQWFAGTAGDDPLLSGADSPSLETYRKARAALAELDLAERRGRLVDVDAFVEWWSTSVAAPIRRAIGTLQTQFGLGAADVIVAALQKAETAVEKRKPADD
jgi:hypothetical protein